MDPNPTTPVALPAGWAATLARGEADLPAGRVNTTDIDALCHEIEAGAADVERKIAARRV
jgi:hypothetical protein